jgi:hypothetical protein
MTELIVVFVTTLSAAVGFCVSPVELRWKMEPFSWRVGRSSVELQRVAAASR